MSKKQRNRKIVAQNNRNRIINRRYIAITKTLFKALRMKVKSHNLNPTEALKIEIKSLKNNLYSIIDKGAKKKVIHKNTASRKKSSVNKLIKI